MIELHHRYPLSNQGLYVRESGNCLSMRCVVGRTSGPICLCLLSE